MSKKYFINNIDGTIGSAILKELTKGEGGEGESEPQHMGTFKDINRTDKPKGVKKILKREKPKLAKMKMLTECDVYVYDCHSSKYSDIFDVNFGTKIFNNVEELEDKVFVFISDVMVWNQTPRKQKEEKKAEQDAVDGEGGEGGEGEKPPEEEKKEEEEEEKPEEQPSGEQEEGEEGEKKEGEGEVDKSKEQEVPVVEEKKIEYVPYEEGDYLAREPSNKYKYIKKMEETVLALVKEKVKVIVICAGVLYGTGELSFQNHFKAAWLQTPEKLPYLNIDNNDGQNLIPTIHINDLVKFVIKVAEAPPENQYLFAIDNSPAEMRTQKAIIKSIAMGAGTGEIEPVEQSTDIIEGKYLDVFKLDFDVKPSPLIVSQTEEPSDFPWGFEKGITANCQKILQEFWTQHNLRPIKIMNFTPKEERDHNNKKFEQIQNELSVHYQIPIINITTMLDQLIKESGPKSLQEDDSQLFMDLEEELVNIKEYLATQKPRKLDETLKVLYRVVKWRLSNNDCKNRGYILDGYPLFSEEAKYIFFPLGKKILARKRAKQEKAKKEEGEGGEGEEQAPEGEEPPEEEEKEEEEAQEEGEEGEGKVKTEFYYPESFIFMKKLSNAKGYKSATQPEVLDFFSQSNKELLIYDSTNKEDFEIFESCRIYIEKEGRPYNYLDDWKQLKELHDKFYSDRDQLYTDRKEQQIQAEEDRILSIKESREKICFEQNDFIQKNEQEVDKIKNLPFRNYLMEYVIPELNDGLVEVSNILPDDPVEFLAEYLFQKSFEFSSN